MKPKAIRVWGKADNFDIEFTRVDSTPDEELWICEVPPDTKDGQYACEIWAINEAGKTAYWTGILYMVNGVCHMEIHQSKYSVEISDRVKCIEMHQSKYAVEIRNAEHEIEISGAMKYIEIFRGCPHAM